MSARWTDQAATTRQTQIALGQRNSRGRVTQADILIKMLRISRSRGAPVGLPEIMAAGIAQHGARLNEIRAKGFQVENELSRDKKGILHSRYWLRFDPERDESDAR